MLAGSTREFVATKKQDSCIFYNGGDLVIRGVAGSGKSIVIMKRAVALNKIAIEKGTSVRIAIFTFTNTLVKYTNALMDMAAISNRTIQILTLDSYCSTVYHAITKKRNHVLYEAKDKKEYAEQAVQKHLADSKKDHRLYHMDSEFWIEEFRWIKEKRIGSSKVYIESDRTGRGGQVRMSQAEKAITFEIFEIYNRILQCKGCMDPEDCFNYIIDHRSEVPDDLKYDYVLVDEAQDLSLVRLMMAKMMTTKAITIAADQAQKIYNTSFSWQDIGINIKGQGSKMLGETFRSTKQITMLADNLLSKNKDRLSAYGEYTESTLPDKDGPLPIIVRCSSNASEKDLIQKTLINLTADKKRVIGILCHTNAKVYSIISWLDEKSLMYERVSKKTEWDLSVSGIKIMTIHSAKGLEFDTVIIPFFTSDMYPLQYIMNNCESDQVNEMKAQERSLIYVGMTRARNELLITYSGLPSPYLAEIDSSLYYAINAERYGKTDSVQFKYTEKIQYQAKTDISHSRTAASNNSSNSSFAKSAPTIIENGNTVYTIMLSDNSKHTFIIDITRYSAQKSIVGKKVGEVFTIGRNEYRIHQITR